MVEKRTAAAMAGTVVGLGAAKLIDFALIGGSIATAAGSVAFAGYMTLTVGERGPLIYGMDHLAIFAQPSRGLSHDDSSQSVDATPVGALPPNVKDHVEGYSLVGAQSDFAWLRNGNKIFAVHIGDDVPNLGRVASIELRDGRWMLVDIKGNPLLAASKTALPPPGRGRFEKSLIFGSGK